MPIIGSLAGASARGLGGVRSFAPAGPLPINYSFSETTWNLSSVQSANGAYPILISQQTGNMVIRNSDYTSMNNSMYRLPDVNSSTSFSSGASYPVSFEAHSGGLRGNKFYFAGGYNEAYCGGSQTSMYSYNYSSNSYTSESSAPVVTGQNIMTTQNGDTGDMYSAMGAKFTTTSHFAKYNGSSWSTLASLPVGASRNNSTNYVSTGNKCTHQSFEAGSIVYVYNVSANTWNSGTATPIAYDGENAMCDGIDKYYQVISNNGYQFTVSTTTWSAANSIINSNSASSYRGGYYNSKLYFPGSNRKSG